MFISFLLCMDLQPYSHDDFSKILRTLYDFRNNTYWVSLFQRNNSLIFRTGVSCFSMTLFYSSLSQPLQRDRKTDGESNTLATRRLEEPFSSYAVVSVFRSGMKQILVLHTTYVLRVPYSCGVVLVFLVLAGNCFWCYLRTQCTIQLCGCVSFFLLWLES